MRISVDLGKPCEVSDVSEQIALLCTAITHADQSEGFEVRALLRLAATLTGDAVNGVWALLGAAAVAAHGVGCDVDEAVETLEDNMNLCAEIEAECPRTS